VSTIRQQVLVLYLANSALDAQVYFECSRAAAPDRSRYEDCCVRTPGDSVRHCVRETNAGLR